MSANKKSVTVTLDKGVAERLSFLRKVTKKPGDVQQQLAMVIEGVIAMHEQDLSIRPKDWMSSRTCPSCGTGTLRIRRPKGNWPEFIGCTNYPKCNHKEEIPKKEK